MRGPLQLESRLLHWAFVHEIDPQTKGFAGHTNGGNSQDLVGPFSERNQSIRDLLDKIVAQSTGAAWISEVSGDQVTNLPEARRVWTIVQYDERTSQNERLLRSIAEQLPN
jgi:hypothetical protein